MNSLWLSDLDKKVQQRFLDEIEAVLKSPPNLLGLENIPKSVRVSRVGPKEVYTIYTQPISHQGAGRTIELPACGLFPSAYGPDAKHAQPLPWIHEPPGMDLNVHAYS